MDDNAIFYVQTYVRCTTACYHYGQAKLNNMIRPRRHYEWHKKSITMYYIQ